MKNLFLFFDIETNGLPKSYKASPEDLDNWPRITQLAFRLVEADINVLDGKLTACQTHAEFCELIKPTDWEIPKEKFWIDNGYSTEKSMEDGIDIKDALQAFIHARLAAKYAVAHNINFDAPIIRSELIRHDLSVEFTAKKICTMMSSTKYCGLFSDKSSKFKRPKLEELHMKLFNSNFEGAHDALADIQATERCFFELVNRNVITL